MYETIRALVRETRGAADFDRCCTSLARALMRTLADSFPRRGVTDTCPLRVTVHVRSDEAYRNFAVTSGVEERAHEVEVAPSASLWRLVREHAAPIVLDVLLGEVAVPGGSASVALTALAESSRTRFSSRDATHVAALPLSGNDGGVFGMVCVEVQQRAAVGDARVLDAYVEDLLLLVDVVAPRLAHAQPAGTAATDAAGIPVVGEATRSLYSYLTLFARQPETMLITGDSGTGKSRLARWVHEHSAVHAGPFETFSMHGLNEDMQLAHLFGWRRGAFTGAQESQPGLIEVARGGTLFIDEIDKLSLKAQGGLLNMLESGSFRRLGETRTRPVETRFLVAANVNLRDAMANGEFREDLYYRISVLPVMLPPLEHRRDEIAAWARFMVARAHRERSADGEAGIDDAAIALLEASPWPGNLRQLDNVLRRAFMLAAGPTPERTVRVDADDVRAALALDGAGNQNGGTFIDSLAASARAFLHSRLAGSADDARPNPEMLHGNLLFAMTWAVALEELGDDHNRIAQLIGKENSLRSRNYHKELRREMRKLAALHQTYGRQVPAEVFRYLE